ncbi:MAG: thioesterase family protein, partial [Pseudomonadota bacterium]
VYLQRIGLTLDLDDPGVGPILAETRCRFRLPVTHPDTAIVGTNVAEIGPHWFIMNYVVVSEKHAALAAEGSARIVSYDYAKAVKCALPDPVRGAMDALEKRP